MSSRWPSKNHPALTQLAVSALPGPAINYLTEQYAGQTVTETILLENPAGRCIWEATPPGKLVYFTDTGAFLREKRIK